MWKRKKAPAKQGTVRPHVACNSDSVQSTLSVCVHVGCGSWDGTDRLSK